MAPITSKKVSAAHSKTTSQKRTKQASTQRQPARRASVTDIDDEEQTYVGSALNSDSDHIMEPVNGEEENGSENSELNRRGAASPMEVEDEDEEQELSTHTSS